MCCVGDDDDDDDEAANLRELLLECASIISCKSFGVEHVQQSYKDDIEISFAMGFFTYAEIAQA